MTGSLSTSYAKQVEQKAEGSRIKSKAGLTFTEAD